ncbi:uncharacterized protein LOC131672624 isoform X1 [Phymastichus coffea]|uniref:uncharacterized protein LOC131672624 isoform X1 n=1 Tax=Phymastichus coffea TaxID=108790 RepID=UPI00273B7E94|nr:uncharacterized protein LOC131672624 isoform X1 [Phymastichus coffea]
MKLSSLVPWLFLIIIGFVVLAKELIVLQSTTRNFTTEQTRRLPTRHFVRASGSASRLTPEMAEPTTPFAAPGSIVCGSREESSVDSVLSTVLARANGCVYPAKKCSDDDVNAASCLKYIVNHVVLILIVFTITILSLRPNLNVYFGLPISSYINNNTSIFFYS